MNICKQYIDLIKKHKYYTPTGLDTVLKKTGYQFTDDCLNNLSCYYDELESKDDKEAQFMLSIKDKYGTDKAYFDRMDWESVAEVIRGLNEI